MVVGHDVESGDHVVPVIVEYRATYEPELVRFLDDIQANISDKQFQLVDARSPERFNGTAPEPTPGTLATVCINCIICVS